MRWTRRALLGSITATVTISGCLGGDGDSGSDETDTEPDGTGATTMEPTDQLTKEMENGGPSRTVQVRTHSDHGDILVGPDGMTLYMFDQDTQGEAASTCYDGCAESWPPLTVAEEPTAGENVTVPLTTFEREDGSLHVAANGWPLYYFAPDEEPGDATGQGANDVWWVLTPDGEPLNQTETETASGSGY